MAIGGTSTSHEKKVVLFGKMGAGKSTTANVLLTGDLRPVKFPYSDGTQGCTKEPLLISEDDWTIMDTVGLGAVTNEKAKANKKPVEQLKAYLKELQGEYSHIIYVVRGERLTQIDEMVWLFFTQVFKGAEEAFVILFTNVEDKWLDKMKPNLPKGMQGVQNMCTARIPPFDDDEDLEAYYQPIRKQAIANLRTKLEGFFEERNYRYVQPEISQLDSEGLTERSRTIIEIVKDKLKNFIRTENWKEVVKVVCTVFEVTAAILTIIGEVLQ